MVTPILVSLHGRKFGLGPGNELIRDRAAFSLAMTPATDGTNVTKVAVQVVDHDDAPVAGVFHFDLFLSDAADGGGLTATTASGAVNVKSGAGGTDLAVLTAKKALRVQTDNTGKYVLNITDTAKTAFKVAAFFDGKTIVGTTLASAHYG
jgi:hypothetical protein